MHTFFEKSFLYISWGPVINLKISPKAKIFIHNFRQNLLCAKIGFSLFQTNKKNFILPIVSLHFCGLFKRINLQKKRYKEIRRERGKDYKSIMFSITLLKIHSFMMNE